MRERYINIIVAGYGGKKARSFRINLRFLKGTALLSALGLTALVTFSAFTFYENRSLKGELVLLTEEREELRALLEKEREKNAYLESFKDKVELLEGKLMAIDRFLKKKGIRKVPSGIGGASSKVDILDVDYVSFLHNEATKFEKHLSRIPLGPPIWGRITSRFGYRRNPFTGRYEFHNGVDIRAPWGTPVRATAEGKVVYAGWRAGYGKTVIIKHAYGFKTLYAHLSKIKVKPGKWVKSGQVIGYVGSTGKSTGPHVHYEVWRYSKRENPVKYMYVRW